MYAPKVIARHVVKTLGKLNNSENQDKLLEEFDGWKPEESRSRNENATFQAEMSNPVGYWIAMSRNKGWEELAEIALRIISIPPTEAACERTFWARREIMTKHISKINDITVEARASLKAGLYKQVKK